MKTINVNDFTTRPVPLGRQGENEVTQVVIPVSDIFDEFGATGSFTLVVRRSGDTLIYPPESVTWDNANVTWTVSATDTAKSGRGKIGLRYTIGNKVKWSQVWESYVEPTLDMEQEDQPDVYTSFLEELSVRTAELHQDIEGITDEARGYAESAAASAASITLPLPITSGGTGAATANGAKANLGIDTTIVRLTGSATFSALTAGAHETHTIYIPWDYTGHELLGDPFWNDAEIISSTLIPTYSVTCEEYTPVHGDPYKRVGITATLYNPTNYDVVGSVSVDFTAMFVSSSNIVDISGE